MFDFQLLADLVAVAAALSGYPVIAVDSLPRIEILAPLEFKLAVCPDNPDECNGIAAYFDEDGQAIRLVDTLDLQSPQGRSFLVHELVHVLQYHARGRIAEAGCAGNLRSEQEAYRVQNAYLRQSGRHEQYGGPIMFMRCDIRQTGDSHMQLVHGYEGR